MAELQANRERWFVKAVNYARGYAKLVHVSTGEKRYAAVLDAPDLKPRLSNFLFDNARSAVARRQKVIERLERMRAYGKKN